MANKAVIGNVVLGLGVIGLGALLIAERGISSARREAQAQSRAEAAAAGNEAALSGPVAAALPAGAASSDGAMAKSGPLAAAEGAPAPDPFAPVAARSATPPPAPIAAPAAAAAESDAGSDEEQAGEALAGAAPVAASPPNGNGNAAPAAAFMAHLPPERIDRHVVKAGDTLSALARAHRVSIGLIRRANDLKDDVIRIGQALAIPQGPFRAVIDRRAYRLAIYLDGCCVQQYAIGVGRGGSTPAGEFEVRSRVEDPEWTSPEGDFFEAGDPANPLGSRWIGFGESGYGIHGTTDPTSIGREASRGCVRLNNDEVLEVYDFLTLGSRVTIQ